VIIKFAKKTGFSQLQLTVHTKPATEICRLCSTAAL